MRLTIIALFFSLVEDTALTYRGRRLPKCFITRLRARWGRVSFSVFRATIALIARHIAPRHWASGCADRSIDRCPVHWTAHDQSLANTGSDANKVGVPTRLRWPKDIRAIYNTGQVQNVRVFVNRKAMGVESDRGGADATMLNEIKRWRDAHQPEKMRKNSEVK